jgi:hypothetical protein
VYQYYYAHSLKTITTYRSHIFLLFPLFFSRISAQLNRLAGTFSYMHFYGEMNIHIYLCEFVQSLETTWDMWRMLIMIQSNLNPAVSHNSVATSINHRGMRTHEDRNYRCIVLYITIRLHKKREASIRKCHLFLFHANLLKLKRGRPCAACCQSKFIVFTCRKKEATGLE